MGAKATTVKADEARKLELTVNLGEADLSKKLTDKDYSTSVNVEKGTTLILNAEGSIHGLYIEWNNIPSENAYILDGNKKISLGTKDFLHEYVALSGENYGCELHFDGKAEIANVYAFSKGDTPSSVQKWSTLEDGADVMIMGSFASEECIFYGAVIGEAVENNHTVQMMYLCDYANNLRLNNRHELLNSLWTLGDKWYPIFGSAEEQITSDMEIAKVQYDEEVMLEEAKAALLKYKPYVVVTHGNERETDNAVDALWGQCVVKAVSEIASEHEVQKLYLRKSRTNAILLDASDKLESIKKAYNLYEVYPFKDTSINDSLDSKYNCVEFGLYSSTVGEDSGNDMFEHVKWPNENPEQEQEQESSGTEGTDTNEQSVSAIADAKEDGINILGIIGLVLIGLGVVIIVSASVYTVMWKKSKTKKKHE